ncbi:ATP-dependent RNA helicase SUV3 precursor [Ophiocordyceps sinensis CO18]|uniref:RNA helicase n=1 Tax=Ophiocordyceps sinensis (strain Co18 / CGMCC 3.14243) TaxID=911162 RepID=T5AN20_OPHSC|nr:ATP-dependent RNA helicase SUV3 precursor [Ophiocordyceps sinensis CO18]
MNCPAQAVASRAGPLQICRRSLSTTLQVARKAGGGGPKQLRLRAAHRMKARFMPALEHVPGTDALPQADEAAKAAREKRFSTQRKQFHEIFQSKVYSRFKSVLRHLKSLQSTDEGTGTDELSKHARSFDKELRRAFELGENRLTSLEENPVYAKLRDAYFHPKPETLKTQIHYAFQSHMAAARFTPAIRNTMKQLVDMRFPHEWFPATRAMQRTIHVHVGPTNSGKTYNALKALENANSGVYAGPLRLLATEVYQRLMAKGHACSLITGEEVRIPDNTDTYFASCTVEMTPLNSIYDVAVIDEIQMIDDDERGNAWSSALLGVQAKEVHVGGEERTVALIQALCAGIGDKCIVHHYKRLSPLATMKTSINNDFNKLQKGDAIVSFSRLAIHALKKNIEEWTGRRCAIIYGNLPPEVRVQQAALFNDPNNDYDFVVASDAIGMGLNLEIRRVIFETVVKFDGRSRRSPTIARSSKSAAEQAASGAAETERLGLVTTMERSDLRMVHQAFKSRVEDIRKASIYPAAGIVEKFASFYPPGTSLSYILRRVQKEATVGPRYRLDISRTVLEIADILQELPLSIYDRLTFCFLPVAIRVPESVGCLKALAQAVAENTAGNLLEIKEIPLEYLDLKLEDFQGTGRDVNPLTYLAKLEALHVTINQYLWLSFRYAGVFRSQAMALHVRSLVEKRLVDALERMNFASGELVSRRRRGRLAALPYDPRLDDMDDAELEEKWTPVESRGNLWSRRTPTGEGAQARPRSVVGII